MNPEEVVTLIVADLKRLRSEKRFSQRELAEKAGVSQGGIAAMEVGRATPTLHYLLVVSQALDADLSELLSRALNPEKSKNQLP